MKDLSLEREILWDDIYRDEEMGEIITPIDLSGLKWAYCDDELNTLIQMYGNLPEDEEEALLLLNELFQKAVKYLKEHLFYEDYEFGHVLKTNFRSLKNFYDFLRGTKNKKWKIKCTIVKHMLSIYDTSEKYNPRIAEITEKTSRLVENKLKNGAVQIIEESDEWDFLKGVVCINGKPIFFNMVPRVKSETSRIQKEINDPNYHTIERLGDNYGLTFELEKKEDIPIFMDYIAKHTFKKGIYDVKSRWIISKEEIETHPDISEVLRKRWKDAEAKREDGREDGKKDETPEDLQDVRLVTSMFKDDRTHNLSLEMRFIVKWNVNENGIVMHDVMWYFKKLKSRIRSETFINPEYIERISKQFMSDLPTLLKKNKLRENKDPDVYKRELFSDLKKNGFISSRYKLSMTETKVRLDDIITEGLIWYYKSLLKPITVNERWKTKYTLWRNVKLSEKLSLYFDELVETS